MLERNQTQEPITIITRQNRRILRDEYYDGDTVNLLIERLTDDDKNYISRNNLRQHEFLRTRWRTIVLSFTNNYLEEYYSLRLQRERNHWFKKYLDLDTHDMNRVPVTLLPL